MWMVSGSSGSSGSGLQVWDTDMQVHTEHALPVAGPVSVPGLTADLSYKAEMQCLRRMNGCHAVTLLANRSPERRAVTPNCLGS